MKERDWEGELRKEILFFPLIVTNFPLIYCAFYLKMSTTYNKGQKENSVLQGKTPIKTDFLTTSTHRSACTPDSPVLQAGT